MFIELEIMKKIALHHRTCVPDYHQHQQAGKVQQGDGAPQAGRYRDP